MQYAYSVTGSGNNAMGMISAGADFKTGGPCHRLIRTLTIKANEPVAGPKTLTNEFE